MPRIRLALHDQFREWDCYGDCPSTTVTHQIGLRVGHVFIGVEWRTEEPEDIYDGR
jgi:hypothetical protein